MVTQLELKANGITKIFGEHIGFMKARLSDNYNILTGVLLFQSVNK